MLRHVSNPPNPWQTSHVEYLDEVPEARLEVFEDRTRSILSRNDAPSVGFEFGLNPYRGCQHACAYCEARRRHELLGFGAGTDFDSKIVVKPRAAELLREAFEAPSWKGDVVVLSGATDCYQPLEASYGLTRQCLEVCAEYRNPVAIITKGALVERDVDVLVRIATEARVTISISIPIWDPDVARKIEPLVPTPQRRIRTIERLAAAGLDVGVSIAPLMPGLDDGMPEILAEAARVGARRAVLSFLRLPVPVDQIFDERLRASLPLRADKVLGRWKDAQHTKMIEALFASSCRRLGLAHAPAGDDFANTPDAGPLAERTFRRPPKAGDQIGLFR